MRTISRQRILDAAETILYFDFDRTVYGTRKNTGTEVVVVGELRQERDMNVEICTPSSYREKDRSPFYLP